MSLKKMILLLNNKRIEREYRNMSLKETYSYIYKNNKWGGEKGEFYSGFTAHSIRLSSAYERMIKKIINDYNIKSICDLGCGDFFIGSKFSDYIEQYVGVDVVPELIEYNQRKYGNDHISFLCRDITNQELPIAQLAVVEQVLQHLSNKEILQFLDNAKEYPYLLITEIVTKEELISDYNVDKPHGQKNRLRVQSGVYLDKAPFNKNVKEIRRINFNEKWDIVTVLIEQDNVRK